MENNEQGTMGEHNEKIIEERKIARINQLLSQPSLTPLEESELVDLQGFVATTIRFAGDAVKSYFEPLTVLSDKIKAKLRK